MAIAHLVGRVILGGYFIYSGLNHFLNYQAMAGYTSSKGIPAPGLAVIITGLLLVLGGASLLLGYRPEIGIILLVVFFIPVTFTMHNFWSVADPQARMGEMINFTKNMALMGALLALLALNRPWPFSLGK